MELLFSDVLRILVAFGIGAVIGSEREYHNKTAGFRTITLICVASALFTILSAKIGINSADRIAANIVTGIGFLGAGAIFKEENKVSGLTTAATIWVSAALGMCAGSGNIVLALFAFVCIMAILLVLPIIEQYIDAANEMRHYQITIKYNKAHFEQYQMLFKKHKLKAEKGKFLRKDDTLVGSWQLVGKHHAHQALVFDLLNDPNVSDFEF